jgi:hypothetical protein
MVALNEIRATQTLAQEVFRVNPALVEVTMGELAYQGVIGSTDATDGSIYQVWRGAERVVAWGAVWPPATVEWQVHPERPELLDEVLDWFVAVTPDDAQLDTQVRDADSNADNRIRARGFSPDPAAPFMRLNMRALDDIEEPQLPPGYRFRTQRDYGGDIRGRVAVHRAGLDGP